MTSAPPASAGVAAGVAFHVEQLRAHGYTVVPSVVPEALVPAMREAVLGAQAAHATEHALLAANPERWREIWPALAAGPPPVGPLANGLLHFRGNPMISDLCRLECLHPYLADPRVVGIAQALLDPHHVRIAQIAITKNGPTPEKRAFMAGMDGGTYGGGNRLWHTDWPHDLTAYDPLGNGGPGGNVGCVAQPFPDLPMALSTIWYLAPANPRTGGTVAMPGSFLDPRNPRGPDCGIDEWSPIKGEVQVSAPPGSVFIQDTRSWHSFGPNFTPDPRVAIVVRYTPWWLTCSYGPPTGDGCSAEWAPAADFRAWAPAMQDLYRHRACGERDCIHPANQAAAAVARLRLREALRVAREGDNDDVVVARGRPELRYSSEQMHALYADLAAMEGAAAPPGRQDLRQVLSPTVAVEERRVLTPQPPEPETAEPEMEAGRGPAETRFGPELYGYLLRRDGFCLLPVAPGLDARAARGAVRRGNEAMVARYNAAGVTDDRSISRQRVDGDSPGPAAVGFLHRALEPWLQDPLLLQAARDLLDPHVRLAHLDAHGPCTFGLGHAEERGAVVGEPGGGGSAWRRLWRASWPHDRADRDGGAGGTGAGAIAAAYPASRGAFALHALLALEDTEVYAVAGSHCDGRDPLGDAGVCPGAAIPGESRLVLAAGQTLLLDSRTWWSPLTGPRHGGEAPPVVVAGCFSPWWLCTDYGGRNQALVGADDYASMSEIVQLLVRHRAEGEADALQPAKLTAARRAMLPSSAPRRSNAWLRVANEPEAYDFALVVGARGQTLETLHDEVFAGRHDEAFETVAGPRAEHQPRL
jgi:hypothetical protein